MYSNSYCSCSFESEIIKIGQSSHKTYSNNIQNFQESTTFLNAHTKKVWKLFVCTRLIRESKHIFLALFLFHVNVYQFLSIFLTVFPFISQSSDCKICWMDLFQDCLPSGWMLSIDSSKILICLAH